MSLHCSSHYNTYRTDPQLCIDGEVIYSQEGTTQGDLLAMAMYAIAMLPLIHHLVESASVRLVWFAGDATAGGQLHHVKEWWDKLGEIGPDFGYQANATKSWLIVKEANYEHAVTVFGNSEVRIMIDGQRHLFAALGNKSFVEVNVTKGSISATRECYTMPIPACSHGQNCLH